MGSARRWFATTTAVVLGVLVGSGLVLSFLYRPGHAIGRPRSLSEHLADNARDVHRVASWAFVALAACLIVLWFATRAGQDRRVIVFGLVAGVSTATLVATGYAIRWDALALNVVRVGSDWRGYGFLFWHDSAIRAVYIGTKRVSPLVVLARYLVHLGATIVFAGSLVTAWRALQRSRSSSDTTSMPAARSASAVTPSPGRSERENVPS